jgi:hypothetical protein
MTTKTIHIDENNKSAQAFLNYVTTLDFVKIEEEQNDIPEWQKEIVRERIKTTQREQYLSQDQFESQIDLEA